MVMRKARVLSCMAALLGLVAAAAHAEDTGESRAKDAARELLGKPAPRLTVKTIDGDSIDLGKARCCAESRAMRLPIPRRYAKHWAGFDSRAAEQRRRWSQLMRQAAFVSLSQPEAGRFPTDRSDDLDAHGQTLSVESRWCRQCGAAGHRHE